MPDVSTVPPAMAALPTPKSHKVLWLVLATVLVLLLVVVGLWLGVHHSKSASSGTKAAVITKSGSTPQSAQTEGLQLNTAKEYGDKYADGLLPVGDGKYTTTSAKTGYVYACSQYAQNLASDKGGAETRGPWFTNSNTQYNINKKLHVLGSVTWKADFTNTVSGGTRTIVTNDLPSHTTGIFPIQSSDPAYTYDRNPNSIKGQTLTYALAANPTYGATPNCMGGEAGIMLTGIALFNAFDAGGRDAGAWEIQDSCSGHPESQGEYHYHTLSSCIKDISVHTVIGFALDGFPITGPQIGSGNILTTADLDECHGLVSTIMLDGKTTTMYHYVMTQDFPYSVSCFRGTAITPPGLQAQSGSPGSAGQKQGAPVGQVPGQSPPQP